MVWYTMERLRQFWVASGDPIPEGEDILRHKDTMDFLSAVTKYEKHHQASTRNANRFHDDSLDQALLQRVAHRADRGDGGGGQGPPPQQDLPQLQAVRRPPSPLPPREPGHRALPRPRTLPHRGRALPGGAIQGLALHRLPRLSPRPRRTGKDRVHQTVCGNKEVQLKETTNEI